MAKKRRFDGIFIYFGKRGEKSAAFVYYHLERRRISRLGYELDNVPTLLIEKLERSLLKPTWRRGDVPP
jgi:hypothetical protein